MITSWFWKDFCPSAGSHVGLSEYIILTGPLERSGLDWGIHAWEEHYWTIVFWHVSNLQKGNIDSLHYLYEAGKQVWGNNHCYKYIAQSSFIHMCRPESLAKNQCANLEEKTWVFPHFLRRPVQDKNCKARPIRSVYLHQLFDKISEK